MVSTTWGGLAARALFYMSTHPPNRTATHAAYSGNTELSVKALQDWYEPRTGGWRTAGWWHNANILTVLTDWALIEGPNQNVNVTDIAANTFVNAQKLHVEVRKRHSTGGQTSWSQKFARETEDGFPKFINEYYDDEGWWALAWIRSYDLTRSIEYLEMAESIFEDMHSGGDNICGGGIWWNKDKQYKAAIANELYLTVAASLANRVQGSKDKYLQIARGQWTWFQESGLINEESLINDGLNTTTCLNNHDTTWSYNQGVILGGLVELSKATGNDSYLSTAVDIAKAAIAKLEDKDGIVHEADLCDLRGNCGVDGPQFRGIFMRNLHYLYKAVPNQDFATTIRKNADSIWAKNRDPKTNRLGISWVGPPEAGGGPTAKTHGCAMDTLVAAMGVVAGSK
ncbi:family 76 putative glycoside hydrolase [Cercophora samala]|uniref:Family 76 putative glycoside hydrolase n=1 Tax=Cercophora samala TaxID=330535 RepID=A0AA40D7F3_9PEZI|nr:family 76 putative glycoside hydrolase [Cercophora samala]